MISVNDCEFDLLEIQAFGKHTWSSAMSDDERSEDTPIAALSGLFGSAVGGGDREHGCAAGLSPQIQLSAARSTMLSIYLGYIGAAMMPTGF